jgi:hypothetical protein
MLFLTIISVASCLALSPTLILMKPDESVVRDAALDYARTGLDSILSSTLPEAFYEEHDGGRVTLGNNTTVEDFLLVETYLVASGTQVSSFFDCNMGIEMIVRELLTGAYDFSLEAEIARTRGFEKVFSLGTPDSSAGYSAVSDYSACGESIRIELVLRWA